MMCAPGSPGNDRLKPLIYFMLLNMLYYFLIDVGFLSIIGVRFLQGGSIMPRKHTLREKIEQRIARKKGEDVFLTREFKTLGGEDQVLRALRKLVDDGRLVRLGCGVYGRATVSSLSGKALLSSRVRVACLSA